MSDWQQPPSAPQAPSKHRKMPAMMSPQPSNRYQHQPHQGHESFASRPLVSAQPPPHQSQPSVYPNQVQRAHQQSPNAKYMNTSSYQSNQPNHQSSSPSTPQRTLRGYASQPPPDADDFASSAPTQIHGQKSHILVNKQVRAKLSITSGEQQGSEFYLNREMTHIGRALENDIVLLDIATSRKHFQIRRHDAGFTVFDLGSANGLYLNQIRISEEELYDGDELEVGETILRYESIGFYREREEVSDTDPGIQSLPSVPAYVHDHASHEIKKRSSKEFMLTLNASNMEPIPKTVMDKVSDFIDSFEDWCYYIMNDQGGLAKMIRITLFILALAGSLWLGHTLSGTKIDVLELEQKITYALQQQNITLAQNLYQTNAHALEDADQQRFQDQIQNELASINLAVQVRELVQTQQWDLCLRQARLFPASHAFSIEIQGYYSQCKQKLFALLIPQARMALWRGEFLEAQNLVNRMRKHQGSDLQPQLVALDYALWVHQYFLKTPLQHINPSPKERRILEDTAKLTQNHEFRKALRKLKRATPHDKKRRALFKLRMKAIKFLKDKNKLLAKVESHLIADAHSLAYLYATQMNIYPMLPRYQKVIDYWYKKRKYDVLSPWIEACLLINPQHEEMIALHKKLTSNALQWYQMGKQAMQNNDDKRALGLMRAALPFLPKEERKQAQILINSL